jgi:HD-GYP domain-containing protein (c-di-GMP phosphodiesterase class II)
LKRSSTAGPTRRRLVFLWGLIPVLVTAIVAVYRPTILARVEHTVYDILVRSASPRPRGTGVVIVDVDERSLATVGQWPWGRDQVGDLITRLRGLGAATVALDIVFAESDRAKADDVLAARLREGHVVLGYAMRFDAGADERDTCVLHPIGLAVLHPREDTGDSPYFQATGVVCSLPNLAEAAGASGFLNAAPDADGILRRVPLIVGLNGRVYPSLALRAVMATTGTKQIVLEISNINAAWLTIDNRIVPVDGKSNLLLRYRGKKKTFPYVSASDVLNGHVPDGMLRGKIVFVGTTALGTREVVATPLDTLFAGVEVQATVADNLLELDFLTRSQFGAIVESQSGLVLGLAVALLVARTGITIGLIGGFGSIAAVWIGAVWLLSNRGVFVSPLFPTLGAIGGLGVMTVAKFTVERSRADTAGRDKAAAQRLMVQSLLSLTETRDAETGRHSRRTQQYARLIAEQLAANPAYHYYLTPERIDLLSSLAPIHDIGKVGIPDRILNKPGPLTPDELAEMRKHPVLGRDVILKAQEKVGVRDDATLAMAKDIVYTHHERWDGTGYPQGLQGTQIPIAGRVMAIVDVYDAVVARNLYKPAMSHDAAVKFIVNGKGTHFDPAVVDAFVIVEPIFRHVALETAST